GTDYAANATFSMGTANATLYAKWTANPTYTVTYHGNGSTGGTVPTDSNSYPQGDVVTVLGNTGTLVKTGYTFAGWNTAANGSGTDYTANATFSMGSANATLYAKWTANPTYTITYNGNGSTGGTVPTDSNSYPQGNTVTVLGNTGTLVKSGYTFAGWNTAANGSGTDYGANATFSMGAANATLYAKWTANPTYTVTYNGNGSTGGTVPTDSNSYPQGDVVTVLGNTGTLVKSGYTFAGWNTAANGSGTDYAANATFSMGTANATLYAKWTANPTYTVTYNGNGSTGGTVPTDSNSYPQGDVVTVLGNPGALVKSGYTFAGWNTAANGSGTDYTANATFSMGTANATLYAKWTANPTYTVTYNGNGNTGGTVPTDSNSYPQGDVVTVLGNTGTLVKSGYTFAGWNTAANGSGTDYAANATFSMGSANATLYAKWTANPTYTVTYNGNGSTGGTVPTDSNSYPQGDVVTVLGNTGTLVKTGYTFAGWNTAANGSGTDYASNATFSMGATNATLYAKWTANPTFTVTYNGNGSTGGTVPTDSNSYPQGDVVTVLGNTGTLVKSGYTFAGWNTAANGSGTDYAANATFSMGSANATLYAKWTANPTYTVTYNGNGSTGGTVPTDSTGYPQGNTVTVLGNTGTLVKTGYTFAGWNTAANGSGTDYAANATFSMGTANATLYAKWTANPTYTVTYNGNGSTGGTVPTDSNSYPQGDVVTVLGNTGTLVKTGYTFTGWNTAANGSGTDYTANATFSMGTANATLYAKWTANPTYTVTYNGNGSTDGTVPTDSNSYPQGNTVTVLGNTGTLVKTGYTFAGWNTAANGSGTDYAANAAFSMGTANATLYAKWTANPTYTVTYNGNGSTGGAVPTDNSSYPQGNTVTVLGNTGTLVKTGYTFAGWNTAANGSGTDYAANATFSMGTANATLYAKWTANPTYTVTYHGNGSTGGTVPTDSNSYPQGDVVTVLGNTGTLVKTGYTFAGWNTAANGSGTDLTFTTADSHATFTVSGAVYSSLTGNMYTYRVNNLQVGANLIQISVTAPDGTGNTYMVTVNREDVSRQPSPGGSPADSITPTATPGPTKPAVDVFNSGIVNVINLVNTFESKVEEAKKSNVKLELADTKGHWAEKTIDTFVKLHVIEGYNDGTFKPDGDITRAEFAVILGRVFDIKSGSNTGVTFKDVGSHWAKGAIEKLAEAGVISGYEDVTFKPDKTITREEMVVLLSRILNLNTLTKDTTKGNFDDLKGSYAANEIKAEAQAGIISGKGDGKFDTKSNATRAEALQIILNALKLNPQLKTLLDSLN
ncbi:InlB B-repeat-containing protein, partial [Paenibacillus sp. P46E]|uniref:InlB B-repeat-containing protein n=1 Tax=Paenibacillus sp. P46E TaxID=1349436 RepID=UPI00096126BF